MITVVDVLGLSFPPNLNLASRELLEALNLLKHCVLTSDSPDRLIVVVANYFTARIKLTMAYCAIPIREWLHPACHIIFTAFLTRSSLQSRHKRAENNQNSC